MNRFSPDQKFTSERSVDDADEPLPVTHVPFIEKHPPDKSMPFANVEVEMVEVMLSAFAEIPPTKVDVAVDVAMKLFAMTMPPTESF